MALQWQDKRLITMLTTNHDDKMISKKRRSWFGKDNEEDVNKPLCTEEYNKHMEGVDRSDQLLSYYGFVQKTVKWSNWAAFHLLDLAIVNSYILYKLSHQGRKHKSHAQYRIDIANSLLLEAGHTTMEENEELQSPHNRLTGRHFPSKLPLHASGLQSQREYMVCSFKKGRTRKQPHTIVNIVTYRYVLVRVLSCTILIKIHSGTCSDDQQRILYV